MKTVWRTALMAAVVATSTTIGTTAEALTTITVNQCLRAKLRVEGKAALGYLQCHAKGAAKNLATESTCLDKISDKTLAAFAKLDLKGGCLLTDDGPTRDGDASTFAATIDAAIGHAGRCDAAKDKLVGKYVMARMGCYAKAAQSDGVVNTVCLQKAEVKLQNAITKAEALPPCSHTGQGVTLQSQGDFHADDQTCGTSPGNSGCSTPGCGSTISFAPNGAAPATDFDLGWRSFEPKRTFVTGGTITAAITGMSGSDCTFSGPIVNAGAGVIDNQRCSDDTSVHCTNAPGGMGGPCTGLGTCEFYWGPPNPLVIGGITYCVVDRVAGSFTGTVNPTSGALLRHLPIARGYYGGLSLDTPCATCDGDGTPNDGVAAGTCNGGVRNGLGCDANGSTTGWPDSGATSLDCPLNALSLYSTRVSDFVGSTGVTDITLSTSSPNCTGAPGFKCACDSCNNVNEEPCATNADCPASDGHFGICGGRHCLSGADAGQPCRVCFGGSNDTGSCTTASACPGGTCVRPTCAGGAGCGRPGEPTQPKACIDDTTTPGDQSLCVDTAPVGDHKGECPNGPLIGRCIPSSGHPQRNCLDASDCCDDFDCIIDPPTPGDCFVENFPCYLDNGVIGGTITAEGAADPPFSGVATPTIAALFCAAPTTNAFINASGLPGAARVKLVETMRITP